jgi:hypothetical protein
MARSVAFTGSPSRELDRSAPARRDGDDDELELLQAPVELDGYGTVGDLDVDFVDGFAVVGPSGFDDTNVGGLGAGDDRRRGEYRR